MKPLIFCLCMMPLLNAAAQSVSGLPIHSEIQEELKGLQGPQECIKGESVIWRYPFQWSATSAAGQKVTLHPNTPMRFIGHVANGLSVESKGIMYTIAIPPGIDARNVIMLDTIKLEGALAEIVKNRLGAPSKVIKDAQGTVFLYTKQITTSRTSFDTAQATTRGTVGTTRFNSTTTAIVPVSESITYSPYSFLIYFDAKGKVDHIDDLVEGTAKWERN